MPVLMFGLILCPYRGHYTGTISTNLPKVKSTGNNGSSGVLLMLVYVVLPEKLPGQKGVTTTKKKT